MKKFLAIALAVVMVLSCAITGFAVAKNDGTDAHVQVVDAITGDLKVTGFFAEKTDAVELKDGDTYTFKFQLKSNGTDSWHTAFLAVSGKIGEAYADAGQEVLILRADNWGWGGGMSDFGEATWPNQLKGASDFVWEIANWDDYVAALKSGASVEMTIGRDGNTLAYEIKVNEDRESVKLTSGIAFPESLYVFLTGDTCELTGIETYKNGELVAPEEPEDPTEATEAPTEAPEEPTEAPEEPTEAPEEPTEAPEEPTEAPEEPTEAPEEPTEAPEEPTEAPEDPTEAPEAPTEAPEEPTEAPEEPTETPENPGTDGPETEEPENPGEALGDLVVDGFFTNKTDPAELKNGGSLTFTFTNKSNGEANWNNFLLGITGVEASAGASDEILIIRADAWGWGGGMSDFAAPDGAGNVLAFETNAVWEEWLPLMQAGCEVTVTVSKDGDTLTYEATMGDYYVKLTATSGVALPEDVYVFLTGDTCVLNNIVLYSNNPETEEPGTDVPGTDGPEATEPEATEPEATEPEVTEPEVTEPEVTEPKREGATSISGNLTVDGFFTNRTNSVGLKSGESYTFKFNNKSNGAANWSNFIMGITGVEASAGAADEILIIRADAWGWGGGMSDFVDPNGTGNALVFDTNAVWEDWLPLMQAGCDVTVTISRSGNTLSYTATMGDYYVKLKATSGVALPEYVFVFFTGEDCVLSNIRTVSSPTNGSSQTGDFGLYTFVALAIFAAAGIVVLQKKRIAA